MTSLTPLWTALAIAAGGLLSVGPVLITLLLLSTQRGLTKSCVFLVGYTGGYLAVGCLTLVIGRRLAGVGVLDTVIGVVMLVFGALFVMLAVRNLRKILAGHGGEPPRLFASIDRMRPRKALFIGALITVINVKNLLIFASAVGELGALAPPYNFMTLPLVVALFCAAPTVPIGLTLVFPRRAAAWLTRLKSWLERNSLRVSVVFLTLFGALFLRKGLVALAG